MHQKVVGVERQQLMQSEQNRAASNQESLYKWNLLLFPKPCRLSVSNSEVFILFTVVLDRSLDILPVGKGPYDGSAGYHGAHTLVDQRGNRSIQGS